MRKWSETSILKKIDNPTSEAYEIKIHSPEITFIGAEAQPDFAVANITFYPDQSVIELKSLKQYFFNLEIHVFHMNELSTLFMPI